MDEKKEDSQSKARIGESGLQGLISVDTPEEQATFERALGDFFASSEEQGVGGGVSLETYRQDGESSLRLSAGQRYLSFRLATENFALNIQFIKEIIKVPLITVVPRTDPIILGILSLRGTVVPLVDLRLRLGLSVSPSARKNRVLIVQVDNSLLGLLVDEVLSVIQLSEGDIEEAPGVFGRTEAEQIQGVGRFHGEMYTLLNLPSVVPAEKMIWRRPGRSMP